MKLFYIYLLHERRVGGPPLGHQYPGPEPTSEHENLITRAPGIGGPKILGSEY